MGCGTSTAAVNPARGPGDFCVCLSSRSVLFSRCTNCSCQRGLGQRCQVSAVRGRPPTQSSHLCTSLPEEQREETRRNYGGVYVGGAASSSSSRDAGCGGDERSNEARNGR
ncbi:uncharacterized protein LOC144934850 isoform X3 [Lampetra fluviatilis]